MQIYDYTWKIGIELASSRQLSTNKPVSEKDVFVDLYTGIGYFVRSVHGAGPRDKAWSIMPERVIETSQIGSLSETELGELRKKADYTPTTLCQPLGDMLFV